MILYFLCINSAAVHWSPHWKVWFERRRMALLRGMTVIYCFWFPSWKVTMTLLAQALAFIV